MNQSLAFDYPFLFAPLPHTQHSPSHSSSNSSCNSSYENFSTQEFVFPNERIDEDIQYIEVACKNSSPTNCEQKVENQKKNKNQLRSINLDSTNQKSFTPLSIAHILKDNFLDHSYASQTIRGLHQSFSPHRNSNDLKESSSFHSNFHPNDGIEYSKGNKSFISNSEIESKDLESKRKDSMQQYSFEENSKNFSTLSRKRKKKIKKSRKTTQKDHNFLSHEEQITSFSEELNSLNQLPMPRKKIISPPHFVERKPPMAGYKLDEDFEPILPVREINRKIGPSKIFYQNGDSKTIYKNGTYVINHGNSILTHFSNGDFLQQYPDGATGYRYAVDKTIEIRLPNGSVYVEFSNGQRERRKFTDNYQKTNVSLENGKHVIISPTKTYAFRSKEAITGKKTIVSPDESD